jgi:hypothetical protein
VEEVRNPATENRAMTPDEVRHFGNGIWLGFGLGLLFTGFVLQPLAVEFGRFMARATMAFFPF